MIIHDQRFNETRRREPVKMSKNLGQIFSGAPRNVRTYGMKFKILEDNEVGNNASTVRDQNSGLGSGFSTPNMANNEGCAEGITEVEDKSRSETLIRFTIENLNDLKDSMFSATSYARNLPWRIMVQPSTKQKRIPIQHFLGVFLHCNNKSDKQSWACYVHAELRLLKGIQSQPPYVKKIQHLFTPKKNYCGFYYFILLDDVLNPLNGFINNDSITLEVHVVADEPWNKSLNSRLIDSSKSVQNKKSVSYREGSLVDVKSIENDSSTNKAIEELFHISDQKLEGGTTSVNVFQFLRDVKSREASKEVTVKIIKPDQCKDSDTEDTPGFEDCDVNSQHELDRVSEMPSDELKEQEVVVAKTVITKNSAENLELDSRVSFTAKEAHLRMLISEQNFIDRQKEELRVKLNDLDEAKTSNMMTTISLLKDKIHILEKQVETEEKKRLTQQSKNYKLERRVKELEKDLEGQYKKFEEEKKKWFERRMQLEEKLLKMERQSRDDGEPMFKTH